MLLSLIISSCGSPKNANQRAADKRPSAEEAALSTKGTPEFVATIFCNNHRYGRTSGCNATLVATGGLKCGHPGAVSEIAWTFMEHKNGKDRYRIERRFPTDGPTPVSTVSEIEFAGTEVVVFEDEFQKLSILPLDDEASEQLVGADKTDQS